MVIHAAILGWSGSLQLMSSQDREHEPKLLLRVTSRAIESSYDSFAYAVRSVHDELRGAKTEGHM